MNLLVAVVGPDVDSDITFFLFFISHVVYDHLANNKWILMCGQKLFTLRLLLIVKNSYSPASAWVNSLIANSLASKTYRFFGSIPAFLRAPVMLCQNGWHFIWTFWFCEVCSLMFQYPTRLSENLGSYWVTHLHFYVLCWQTYQKKVYVLVTKDVLYFQPKI